MPLDSLQAVVDALVQSVDSVHPDIRVVLVTFSNRIGVYRSVLHGLICITEPEYRGDLTLLLCTEFYS
jgi:hypothetical protein